MLVSVSIARRRQESPTCIKGNSKRREERARRLRGGERSRRGCPGESGGSSGDRSRKRIAPSRAGSSAFPRSEKMLRMSEDSHRVVANVKREEQQEASKREQNGPVIERAKPPAARPPAFPSTCFASGQCLLARVPSAHWLPCLLRTKASESPCDEGSRRSLVPLRLLSPFFGKKRKKVESEEKEKEVSELIESKQARLRLRRRTFVAWSLSLPLAR